MPSVISGETTPLFRSLVCVCVCVCVCVFVCLFVCACDVRGEKLACHTWLFVLKAQNYARGPCVRNPAYAG